MDDDSESIITNERYQYVAKVVKNCVHKNRTRMTSSDKIDRIVTNRILALPIFAVVMFAIYGIAMGGYSFSIGTMGTDWANDVLFGEIVPGAVDAFLGTLGVSGWLYGLIQDGIVAGVGAVLGFVPANAGAFPAAGHSGGCRLYGPGGLHHGSDFSQIRTLGQELYPDAGCHRLRRAGNYGLAND